MPTIDDRDLIRQFENCTYPFEQWDHRAHIKVAFLYLREYPFDVALEKIRTGVMAYNAANYVAESQFEGYNETTTCAFMHLIHSTMKAYGEMFATQDAKSFCETHPQLLSKYLLRLFYSPEQRGHPDAKTCFVEPDLAQLPKGEK